jgi:HEXXH motif-containing protein
MKAYDLDPTTFERLASGRGGEQAIRALRSAQVSKHLLLIAQILRNWPGDDAERDTLATLLDTARRASPDRFDDVVGAPLVGAWAAIVNRALERDAVSWTDAAHLGALAVVACAATAVDGSAIVPVRDGVVAVPGLGVATAGAGSTARLIATAGQLALVTTSTTVSIPHGSTDDSDWWCPVRQLHPAATDRPIRLALDDLDPYRHGHHAPPASRLPPSDFHQWQDRFAEAWHLLSERLPERAEELAAGLRTLIPLVQGDERTARSATIRHAFGAFGLTRPSSAPEFAVTLVHEFQHSKLSAILDVTPLSDPDDPGRYFAPWRTDPRPLAGLLQGVYAFVGVADTWRALCGVNPSAEIRFAEARLQVDRGLSSLEGSRALTPAGRAIVTQLRGVTDGLLAEPVPPAAARAAERSLASIRQRWVERNGNPQT